MQKVIDFACCVLKLENQADAIKYDCHFHHAIQGPRNDFELTGAKNWWLVNSGQEKETFWSHLHYKLLRRRTKSAKVHINRNSERTQYIIYPNKVQK